MQPYGLSLWSRPFRNKWLIGAVRLLRERLRETLHVCWFFFHPASGHKSEVPPSEPTQRVLGILGMASEYRRLSCEVDVTIAMKRFRVGTYKSIDCL